MRNSKTLYRRWTLPVALGATVVGKLVRLGRGRRHRQHRRGDRLAGTPVLDLAGGALDVDASAGLALDTFDILTPMA